MKVAICKFCHSGNVEPFNKINDVYDYFCRTCRRTFSVKAEKRVKIGNTKGSKISKSPEYEQLTEPGEKEVKCKKRQ